jgi:PAS domain S-box-containing protein
MRDQHRAKQDLIGQVVALRKQVDDLREALATRGRVEEALHHSEEQLRGLVDGSPVGLCLFRSDGAPLAVNRAFARMLGYDSPAELLDMARVGGLFASREEQARVVELTRRGEESAGDVLFRPKNGGSRPSWVMGSVCRDPDGVALVVLQPVSPASSDGMRSA